MISTLSSLVFLAWAIHHLDIKQLCLFFCIYIYTHIVYQNPVWESPLSTNQSCHDRPLPIRLTTRVVVEVDGQCRSLMKIDENPETFPTMDPGNGKFPKQIVGLNGKYYRFLHVQLNYLFFHEKWGFLVPRPEVPRQGLFGETRSGAAIVVVLARDISSLYPPSFLEVLGWERIEFLHGHWTSVASTCRCSGGVLVLNYGVSPKNKSFSVKNFDLTHFCVQNSRISLLRCGSALPRNAGWCGRNWEGSPSNWPSHPDLPWCKGLGQPAAGHLGLVLPVPPIWEISRGYPWFWHILTLSRKLTLPFLGWSLHIITVDLARKWISPWYPHC